MEARRLVRAALAVAATAVVTACGVLPGTSGICPAIAYSTAVTVALDDSWSERADLHLDVQCVPAEAVHGCDLTGSSDGPRWDGSTMAPPATVQVTVNRGDVVLYQDDVALSVRTVDHPHGRGCPGLQLAEATIPST